MSEEQEPIDLAAKREERYPAAAEEFIDLYRGMTPMRLTTRKENRMITLRLRRAEDWMCGNPDAFLAWISRRAWASRRRARRQAV